MTTINRLADSCLIISNDDGTSIIDPGTFTFDSGKVDLDAIGDVQRVFITHEHGDHVKPEFVRWLLDRGSDVTVHSNQAVADLLAPHDIEVATGPVIDATFEDVAHETTPLGTAPPNRAYTIANTLTHPGDSYQPAATAPVLALPLLTPWGSMFQSMEFARRLAPQQVVPIHDFYVSDAGRQWIYGMAKKVLGDSGIEFVPLDWNDGYTV